VSNIQDINVILDTIVLIIALAGIIWGAFLFVSTRLYRPKLSVRISTGVRPFGSTYRAVLLFEVINRGKKDASIESFQVFVNDEIVDIEPYMSDFDREFPINLTPRKHWNFWLLASQFGTKAVNAGFNPSDQVRIYFEDAHLRKHWSKPFPETVGQLSAYPNVVRGDERLL
jgi:hypothetical protein